jgi:DNA polymerase I
MWGNKRMEKERILLIDGNNLAHRAFHKLKGLTTKGGRDSTVIYGVPYLILSYIRKLNPDRVYVAFDGGRSSHRKEVLPTYKIREPSLSFDSEQFYEQMDWLKADLHTLNIHVMCGKGMEADDLIYYLIRKIGAKEHYFTIISSDKDFLQLIDRNVKVLNPFKEKVISLTNCKEEVGYEPSECVDYLILDGDKSDKIPGVPGMGPKRIRDFLDEFGSIEDYLESEKPSKWNKKAIQEAYERNNILINLKLFYLKFFKRVNLSIQPAVWDRGRALKMFNHYEVRLLSKPENVELFKKLK